MFAEPPARIGRATAVRGLATNLPVRVAPTTVGAFYRLRWTIENLFRTLKSVGRLDELSSGKPAIVNVFISATLIGLAISQAICVLMRSERADQGG